jgi:hypothetical protein
VEVTKGVILAPHLVTKSATDHGGNHGQCVMSTLMQHEVVAPARGPPSVAYTPLDKNRTISTQFVLGINYVSLHDLEVASSSPTYRSNVLFI